MDNKIPTVIRTNHKEIIQRGNFHRFSVKEATGDHKYAIANEITNGVKIPQLKYKNPQTIKIMKSQIIFACFICTSLK